MTNTMRWRSGDPQQVISDAVGSSSVIEIGDLVECGTGSIPTAAGDHTWDTSLATTQEQFHDAFLGVAMQQSRSGDTAPIRVATGGVHEFTCASATFALGALVGPAKQSGNLLENQKVVSVASENLAIGRVAQAYPSATTKVKVQVFSTKLAGGPQAAA